MELILYIVYNIVVTLHKIQYMEGKMATSRVTKNALVLEHDNGVVDGKQRLKKQTYSNIKLTASNDALHAVGISIDALSQKNVMNVLKNQTSVIEA